VEQLLRLYQAGGGLWVPGQLLHCSQLEKRLGLALPVADLAE
jgi:hypothetical protein